MNNVYPLRDQEACYEEASLWIARLDRGLSKDETEQLRAWQKNSKQNREALLELAALWDKMDSLALLSELFEPPKAPARPVYQKPVYLALAASLLGVVLALGWFLPEFGANNGPNPLVDSHSAGGVYKTGVGVHSTVNLPDGTLMLLNTDTLVRVDYSPSQRLIRLERGEVHVEVAHEPDRPLRVMAGSSVVQALGTAFNVHLQSDGNLEVMVTDGEVLLTEQQPAIGEHQAPRYEPMVRTLRRGDKFMLREKQIQTSRVSEEDMEARLSWREGKLVFRGETLEQALNELSRYTSVSFELADEDLKQLRIAGMFKTGDVNGLLMALRENFNIEAKRTATNRIVLTERSVSQ